MAIISTNFLKNFNTIFAQPLVDGRVLRICMQAEDCTINYIIVHIDPSLSDLDKKNVWAKVYDAADFDNMLTFIVGDYNLVDQAEGRLNLRANSWSNSDKA